MAETHDRTQLSDGKVWRLLHGRRYRQVATDDAGAPKLAFETLVVTATVQDDPKTMPVAMMVTALQNSNERMWVRIETVVDAATGAACGLKLTKNPLPDTSFLEVIGLELLRPGSRVIIEVPDGNEEGARRRVYDQPLAAVLRVGRHQVSEQRS